MIVEDDLGNPVLADTLGAAELLSGAGIVNAGARIRDWKRRGLLAPKTVVGRRPVYEMEAVWDVEMATRLAKKTRGFLTSAP